ncbi:MAG: hypothetical protein ACLPKW_33560 [Acetobacteraceae bacterium]
MELLTAPASVLLARVYRQVIVHHYRLYWVSLDLTDREHFVSANCPVIPDLSGEPIVLATEVPIGSVLRVHTVSGALRTADRPCGPTSPCGSLLAIQEARRFPSLLPIGYRLPQCRRARTCR